MLHICQYHRCNEPDSKQFFTETVTLCFGHALPTDPKTTVIFQYEVTKGEANASFSKDKILVLEMWPPLV